jgi:hypothetical protein
MIRIALAGFFFMIPAGLSSREPSRNRPPLPRAGGDYSGGILLLTDGSVPNGPCFRVSGHVSAPGFFDNLKRIDKAAGVTFRRGSEIVTQFPSQLFVSFVIYDLPCSTQYEQAGTRVFLTPSQVEAMQLSFYWKRGIDLRPIASVTPKHFSVEPVVPYATALVHDLPEKFEWFYQYAIASEGVPLTDSLVLILRTPGGSIEARVAARL